MRDPRARGCHDSQADFYDENVRANLDDYIRENYFKILDRVVAMLPAKPNLKVLDIGIGTGLLAERMRPGIELHGIDISTKMMEKVREKGLPVHLKEGSFLAIPYDEAFFDAVVSTFAFHHLTSEEKEMAYLEMDRVLSPSGVIIIGDFMYENEEQRQTLVRRFTNEGRTDMLEEMEDEYFTYLDKAVVSLARLGYQTEYERGSTISWILKAIKTRSVNATIENGLSDNG